MTALMLAAHIRAATRKAIQFAGTKTNIREHRLGVAS
jgi:hypothetical protein